MKKIITILVISLIMASSGYAQVFMTDSDYENPREDIETNWGVLPEQWTTNDQANDYAPLGSGVGLLIAMGGAYLMKRVIQNNKQR